MGDLWFEDLKSKKIVEPNWELYKKSGVTIYLYGKNTPRLGRKMGHLNLSMENPSELLETLIKLQVWDQDSLERMLN